MRLGLGIHSTELYFAGTAVLELPGGVLATDGRGFPRSPSIGALQLGTARDALRLHGCGGHCHGGRSAHLCSLASYKYYRVRVAFLRKAAMPLAAAAELGEEERWCFGASGSRRSRPTSYKLGQRGTRA